MGVERSPQGDTAGSARMISKQKLKNAAAIASEHAASIYGLEILETQIEDEHSMNLHFFSKTLPIPNVFLDFFQIITLDFCFFHEKI